MVRKQTPVKARSHVLPPTSTLVLSSATAAADPISVAVTRRSRTFARWPWSSQVTRGCHNVFNLLETGSEHLAEVIWLHVSQPCLPPHRLRCGVASLPCNCGRSRAPCSVGESGFWIWPTLRTRPGLRSTVGRLTNEPPRCPCLSGLGWTRGLGSQQPGLTLPDFPIPRAQDHGNLPPQTIKVGNRRFSESNFTSGILPQERAFFLNYLAVLKYGSYGKC